MRGHGAALEHGPRLPLLAEVPVTAGVIPMGPWELQ